MSKSVRLWGAILAGIAGVAIFVSLGLWQLDRLEQKRALLAAIEARLAAPPTDLPDKVDPEKDRFRPVRLEGEFTGEYAFVLSSRPGIGPGVRVIAVLETTTGRRILVDRGFLADTERSRLQAGNGRGPVSVIGHLDWPRDYDRFTPAPDRARNLWFSRTPEPIAEALSAEPLLVVAASAEGAEIPGLILQPLGIDIRNDHLEYAVTWFALALIWAVMSLFLIVRLSREAV